jgi:hypothetical protein
MKEYLTVRAYSIEARKYKRAFNEFRLLIKSMTRIGGIQFIFGGIFLFLYFMNKECQSELKTYTLPLGIIYVIYSVICFIMELNECIDCDYSYSFMKISQMIILITNLLMMMFVSGSIIYISIIYFQSSQTIDLCRAINIYSFVWLILHYILALPLLCLFIMLLDALKHEIMKKSEVGL